MTGRTGEVLQESLDVGLLDPGQAAIRARHGFQGRSNRPQLSGHRPGPGIGQQPVDGRRKDASPAPAAGMQFRLGAAPGTVDVEPDAGAGPAGRAVIYPPGQDSPVPAGAQAGGPLGRLIAVDADASIWP